MTMRVIHGDMREQLRALRDEGVRVHSIVTDPPYHLSEIKTSAQSFGSQLQNGRTPAQKTARAGFMGKAWDGGDIAFQPATWRLCFDLLPPGGHMLCFGGTRTFHRLVCAIEDAGFEIRETIAWLHAQGFPKSLSVSKAIDRAAGAEREVIGNNPNHRAVSGVGYDGIYAGGNTGAADITVPATAAARQWDGWGTALKPAMELICVARKPLVGTVAANVLATGTGALNIDGCRIETTDGYTENAVTQGLGTAQTSYSLRRETRTFEPSSFGRWPANVCHDGSDEVVKAFPDTGPGQIGGNNDPNGSLGYHGGAKGISRPGTPDSGSAARFFYSARPDDEKRFHYSSKADSDDRLGSKHPTVKPVDLMRWLVRLVTPPNGTCLDPFAGSGATGMACMAEGFDCILVEAEAEYVADIKARIAHVRGDDTPLFAVAAE